jgi:hypothetical protein
MITVEAPAVIGGDHVREAVMSVRGRPVRSGALALLLAVPLVLVACSSGGSNASGGTGSASANSPIVIGYEVPLTGTAAVAGKQEQQGWNLGLKVFGHSVNGHRIVTYFADTGGDPAVALSEARLRRRFGGTAGRVTAHSMRRTHWRTM